MWWCCDCLGGGCQEEGKEPGGAVVDAKKAAKEKRMAERLAKAKEGANEVRGAGGRGGGVGWSSGYSG